MKRNNSITSSRTPVNSSLKGKGSGAFPDMPTDLQKEKVIRYIQPAQATFRWKGSDETVFQKMRHDVLGGTGG